MLDRTVIAAYETPTLEGFHDRRVGVGRALADLFQDGLLGKRALRHRGLGPQSKGKSVGEQPAPAKDPDRSRTFLFVETCLGRFRRGQRAVVVPQRVEEAALGKPTGEHRLASRREARYGLVLLVDHRQMLRSEPLEASAELVGGQSYLTAERLLVHGRAVPLAQGEEQRAFWPRESDRGRPDRGIPGCLGHSRTRRGPD